MGQVLSRRFYSAPKVLLFYSITAPRVCQGSSKRDISEGSRKVSFIGFARKKYLLGFYELDDPNGEEVKEDL
ncbi:hypothetical protein LEP1GSC058_0373 [Leptospira fainei serovar Hurstbridge str. BUT 6]|uniref:Uncharacterized protein n=1 Tax=Leptospira fainei serovar Hurstbridge str. BUT 6 TaxID=1193011 RepID=S3V2L2_9LEPT|nr:hypothetical protein LEP1GSC058_0373 [Leptospira fainei serovar Hurstbridge str. BUT 6]